MFSLRHTITKADDEGVTFSSVYDGDLARFTPELAADVQRRLGSDIAMALDVCLPAGASNAELAEAVERTTAWGRRQLAAPRADGQLVFGIAQGGVDPELRRRSIEEITDLGFDGYALGGLSVGEDRETMLATLETAAPQLPADRARYFMGIGDPAGILEVIERGVDMFDCVLPDPSRPSGDGVHAEREAEPAQRSLHARPASARRGVSRARRALDFHARIFVIL